jgi:4-amino-4-deoxy-L-arabinose transferase-like glycosyltransferase
LGLNRHPVGCQLGGPRKNNNQMKKLMPYALAGVILAGITLRLFIALQPGNAVNSPWSGGSDAPAYLTLAQNLVAGQGFSYAGEATAFRPPVYPLILAASMELFGRYALAIVRWLQFLEGVVAAFLCAAIAEKIYGKQAKTATFVISLFFPTLVVMPSILGTESSAILAVAILFYFLLRYRETPSWRILIALGTIVGFTTLLRFNMALLGVFVLYVLFLGGNHLPKWRGAATTVLVSAMVIAPWIVRNMIVFHGEVLLSTQGGFAAAAGILEPEGRSQVGDTQRVKGAIGWALPQELETNQPHRHELPAEPALDRLCWQVAFRVWRETGWELIPVTLRKLSYFWLSTDQIFSTTTFSPKMRMERAAGVLIYWTLLALGVWGWIQTRRVNPALAYLFLFYAVLVTILHVPFNMNTRYRVPLVDPLIAVLAGIGFIAILAKKTNLNDDAIPGTSLAKNS